MKNVIKASKYENKHIIALYDTHTVYDGAYFSMVCFFLVKKLAKKKSPKNKALKYKLHICSINNFPTAAGLASSAAGYSCLGLYLFLSFFHSTETSKKNLKLWDGKKNKCNTNDGIRETF